MIMNMELNIIQASKSENGGKTKENHIKKMKSNLK